MRQTSIQFSGQSSIQNQRPKYCSRKLFKCAYFCCGFLLLILSIQVTFLPRLIHNMVINGISNSLVMDSTDSPGYDDWMANNGSTPTVPWMEVRFWNVTNKYDVIHNGAWPQLKITPRVAYNEFTINWNVSFSEDKNLRYGNAWSYYTRIEDKSYLDPKAEITIISPLIGALYYNREWNTEFSVKTEGIHELEKMLKYVNISDVLFWTGTVEELLSDLYHPHIPIHIGNSTLWWNKTIPFGLMGNGSKATSNGSWAIYGTGHSDSTDIGTLKWSRTYNGSFIECWAYPYDISPGHGTEFGINTVKKGDSHSTFASQLWKNIEIDYNHSYTYKGIELYRYVISLKKQFDLAKDYPPNQQFYQFGLSGPVNITSCESGLPLFISLPYCLGCDEKIMEMLPKMGLRLPNFETDMATLDVEPITGAVVVANKSLQINTMLHSLPWIKGNDSNSAAYRNLPNDAFIPMYEMCEVGGLTDADAKEFKSLITDTLMYADVLRIVGYVACALLMVFTHASLFVYAKYHSKSAIPRKIHVNDDMKQHLFSDSDLMRNKD